MRVRRDGVTRAGGLVLPAVVILGVLLLTLGVGLMDVVRYNSRAERERGENVQCFYLAQAGLDAAFAEIASGADTTGNGLGAMGIVTPISYTDSQGNTVGEFKAMLTPLGTDYEVLVVAGIPSLANPRLMKAVRGLVDTAAPYLVPPPTAVSMVGALQDPQLQLEGNINIDGGSKPAFVLSSASYAGFMDELGDDIYAGNIAETDLKGGETSTYEHGTAGTLVLPVVEETAPSLTVADLDTYRQNFRAAADAMAATADRVVTAPVSGNQTWGTVADPEITVIDVAAIGTSSVFATSGQTITGHGTLIIQHTIWPSNVNIDWTGDIFVVGYNGDSDDTFLASGFQGTVNGNFIVLGNDTADAALQLWDSGGTASDLTINGNLLCLAGATSYEAEIEVSYSSSLTVNGIAGMYGSHAELQTKHSGSSIDINGTLVMGITAASFPSGQQENIENFGNLNIVYNEALVQDSARALGELQEQGQLLQGVTNTAGWGGGPRLVARIDEIDPYDAYATIESAIQQSADPNTTNFGLP